MRQAKYLHQLRVDMRDDMRYFGEPGHRSIRSETIAVSSLLANADRAELPDVTRTRACACARPESVHRWYPLSAPLLLQ